MSRRLSLLILASLLAPLPRLSAADVAPEALLPADCLAYVRVDGLANHREAWAATALGGITERELMPLIDKVLAFVGDENAGGLFEGSLLRQSPDQILKLQASVALLPRLRDHLATHGFAAAVEAAAEPEPVIQLTVVFPRGGLNENRSALFAGARLLVYTIALGESELRESDEDGRPMLWGSLFSDVTLACWPEGDHMLLTIGTTDPRRAIDVVEGRRENLESSPLTKRVHGFDAYETWLGGFVDLRALVRWLDLNPDQSAVLAELGLEGLDALVFHAGYEGRYLRSTVTLDVPKERRGLLHALTSGGEVELDKLPPLPPDVTAVTATAFDAPALYDSLVRLVDALPGEAPEGQERPSAQAEIEGFERAAGLNLRDDLFAKLGSPLVLFTSPAQGPLVLGTVAALPVRDAEATLETISQVFRVSGSLSGTDVALTQHTPRGGAMHVLRFGQTNALPYWTHGTDGEWLLFGMFPQPVAATLSRAAGRLSTSSVPEEVTRVVRGARGTREARLVALRVVDPRPPVRTALSLLPLGAGALAMSDPGLPLSVGLIPNAQAVTEPLSHNVSLVLDEGEALRYENYSTLPLPPGAEWLDDTSTLVGVPLLQFYILLMGL